jgi:hypothetical protein
VIATRRDRNQAIIQAFADLLSAGAGWTLYYVFRKIYIEPIRFGYKVDLVFDQNYWLGLLIIPISWIILYQMSGSYHDVFRKSRLGIVGNTLLLSLIGCTLLFFSISLDDFVPSYQYYYSSFLALFGAHAGITVIQRAIVSTWNSRRIQSGKIRFNTLLVGSGQKSWDTYKKISEQTISSGNHFLGYIPVNGSLNKDLSDTLKNVGNKLGDKLKGLLPSQLPTTKAGLTVLQQEQIAVAADIESRITTNQIIKDELIPQLEAAQSVNDSDQVASIYSQLDAADYTDPDKLTEQLNSVNTNIETLDVMIAEAAAIETPNSTLSVEDIDLGVAEEDVYDVGSNPDLVTQINRTYTENTGNTPQFYV